MRLALAWPPIRATSNALAVRCQRDRSLGEPYAHVLQIVRSIQAGLPLLLGGEEAGGLARLMSFQRRELLSDTETAVLYIHGRPQI